MSDTPRTDQWDETGIPTAELCRLLERELTEAQHRIRTLIEERDSARIQADHKWKLREEFEALLGTDDVGVGVERIKEAKCELTDARRAIESIREAGQDAIDYIDGKHRDAGRVLDGWRKANQ